MRELIIKNSQMKIRWNTIWKCLTDIRVIMIYCLCIYAFTFDYVTVGWCFYLGAVVTTLGLSDSI